MVLWFAEGEGKNSLLLLVSEHCHQHRLCHDKDANLHSTRADTGVKYNPAISASWNRSQFSLRGRSLLTPRLRFVSVSHFFNIINICVCVCVRMCVEVGAKIYLIVHFSQDLKKSIHDFEIFLWQKIKRSIFRNFIYNDGYIIIYLPVN